MLLNSMTTLQHTLKNSQLLQGKTSLLGGTSLLLLSPTDCWEALSVKVVLWGELYTVGRQDMT